MNARLIGAIFVVLGCGGVGFSMSAGYRREIAALTELQAALQIMRSELSCRMTPLPELFLKLSGMLNGSIAECFGKISEQLQLQLSPDACSCMQIVLAERSDLPVSVKALFLTLGRGLGVYDLDGQLELLDAVTDDCSRRLETLNQQKEDRIRQYQTLGLCAGAGLAILLI